MRPPVKRSFRPTLDGGPAMPETLERRDAAAVLSPSSVLRIQLAEARARVAELKQAGASRKVVASAQKQVQKLQRQMRTALKKERVIAGPVKPVPGPAAHVNLREMPSSGLTRGLGVGVVHLDRIPAGKQLDAMTVTLMVSPALPDPASWDLSAWVDGDRWAAGKVSQKNGQWIAVFGNSNNYRVRVNDPAISITSSKTLAVNDPSFPIPSGSGMMVTGVVSVTFV